MISKLRNKFSQLFTSVIFTIATLNSYSQSFGSGELLNEQGFGYNKIVSLDADKDGDLDLLSFPNLYINDGTGKKLKTITLADPKLEIQEFAIADLDNDKDIDIVVLYEKGNVEFYFKDASGFKNENQNYKINYPNSYYYHLHLFDVNSDGICDLMVEGIVGPSITAYIGNIKRQFTYFKPFNTFFKHKDELIGIDLDKDGIQEVLVINPKNEKKKPIYRYAYSYSNEKYILKDSFLVASPYIDNYKLVDMDKDGDEDFVYASGLYKAGIYWNERKKNGSLGEIHTLITNLDMNEFNIGDFNNDGDMDFSYITSKNQDDFINWAENKGDNIFVTKSKSLLPNIKNSTRYIFEDFNGDKIRDVAFYDDFYEKKRTRFQIVLQENNGKLKESNTWIVDGKCEGFAIIDLDNNGIKDIVGYFKNELFFSLIDSLGNYSEVKELALNSFKIGNLKVADLDNDGQEDIIVSTDDNDGGKIGWLKNLGKLKFSSCHLLHEGIGRVLCFEILETRGDKNLDIVVNYWVDEVRGIYVYKNSGKGIFYKERETVNITKNFIKLFITDMDQDGKNDITDFESKTWYKRNLVGTWEEKNVPFVGRFIKGIFMAKVDNDTALDYLIPASDGLRWHEFQNNKWHDTIIFKSGGDIEMMKTGDMDGDGFDDIVCFFSKTVLASGGYSGDIGFTDAYSLILLLNDGSGNFKFKTIEPSETITDMHLYDIDLDGDQDIITSAYHWPLGGITIRKNLSKSR